MMKQQPFATKLNLSKLCRTIMVLAFFKISLLSTLIWDSSLLDSLNLTLFNTSALAKEKDNSSSITAISKEIKIAQQSKVQKKQIATSTDKAQSPITVATALNNGTQQIINQSTHAANVSNWNVNNGTFPVSTAVQGEKNSAPSFFASKNIESLKYELLSTGIDSSDTPSSNTNKKAWWKNMLNIENLPIPGFGTASVAHAAALDNVPAPNVTNSAGSNNFTPNSQRIAEGENLMQNNNATSPNAIPATAGTAGPQLNYQSANSEDITQSITPPAPNVNTYSPREDPNFKQKELARREQELLMLKKQMEQRYAELQAAEDRVNKLLKSAEKNNKQKSSSLVSVYANMKPKQAAIALGKIDERVAVQILSGLSPKQAGEILSYADPEVTAKLTELLTRTQP